MYTKLKILPLIAISTLMACGTSSADDASKKDNQQKEQHESSQASAMAPKMTQTADTEKKSDTDTVDINKVSEALGHFIGRNLNTSGIHFDVDNIIKGIRAGAAGQPAPMSDADYEKAMAELQQKAYNAVADTNLEAADKFMEKNAKEKDVVVLMPGQLQYTILQEGSGPTVPEHGTPLINYTGKYINGTVFGTSENAGGPITVPIDQTIPGFNKGIAGMKEGEKRRLFVHPAAGYGRQGQLPPNSLLIFDIEVVKATSPDKDMLDAEGDDPDDEDFDDDLDETGTEKKEPAKAK